MASPARRIVIILAFFAAGLIGSAIALSFGVHSDGFRRWLQANLSQRTGYAIAIGRLRLALPLRLVASDVTVDKDGKRILSAGEFKVAVSPLDVFAKTIHNVEIERPVLEMDLAEILKSGPKDKTNLSLRNLKISNGLAVIRTEAGSRLEIPGITLSAQNLNLGGQTGITLRAEILSLDGVADIAIERRDREFSLRATMNAKPTTGLLGRGVSANAQPLVKADGTLRMPLGQEPTIEAALKFNRLKLGGRELTGELKTIATLDKNFAAGTFSSQLGVNGFPNIISPVPLQIRDEPALLNAHGGFSVSDKSIALKSLTLHSHLGNAEAIGNLVFTPVLSVNDGHIAAHRLDWQIVKTSLPEPFNQWIYQGQGELEMKLRGPWNALQFEGLARSENTQVRGANFSLGSFSLRAPFKWANGQLAVQNGRIDAKKFSLEGKLRSGVAQAEIGAISYDPKKPGLVTAQIKLSGGQFSSADSSKVGEDLALEGSVEIIAQKQRKVSSVLARLSFTAGELLWGKFFGELKAQKPVLVIDAEYDRDTDRLQCHSCTIALATVGQMNLAGSIETISQTPQLRLQARSDNLSPAGFFQYFLRETYHRQYPLLDKLTVGGQMAMQLQLDGAPEQLALSGNLSLSNGEIASLSNDWQLAAMSINLPFQISLDDRPLENAAAPVLGSLSIERARFGNQQLGPLTTTISLSNNALRLHQPLHLSLFGGAVELRNVTWRDIVRDPKAVTFSADTKRLQLQELTAALNWPRFAGQLDGAIPEVESVGNTLRSRGEIQADLFGGRLRLSKLEIENLFSELPSIKMSAKLESIDLEQLSKTFAFGRISGILEGTIEDLVITDGQPSQMRADLHSVQRSGVDQRISVDALNKITVLSSGQEAGALYGGLAGFFDSFRYSKLGFKAVLRNDRLTLRGVESQGENELLVVGSFLPPTVNIVSHTQVIAFSELVRRLERIKTDKPAIK
ncbi:MAG TPA: hypothetical protein VMZ02_08520 [Candidatus Limnocylindrales bacterium]|nr:hypothetical protein [Candidatus Limnocylindrales bacterium]